MAKIKLVENVLVPARLAQKLDIPLAEAALEGSPHKALAVYRFPFTRPGQKNLNGRIYPHKLWDRVFRLFAVKSTVSLCDHPEGEGDPAKIWAVLRNPQYNADKTLGLVDCYILDNELGRTANGVLLAGGDLGLSSSGVGDFEADGVTVDAGTYELERFFDWVLSPSYSVFGNLGDQISEARMSGTNDKTNGGGCANGGANGGAKHLSLREKRELEASFKRIYEDVRSIAPARERLARAKEALTFYEDADVDSYKNEFEDLVKEAEAEFESVLAKGERADAAKKETDELSQEARAARREADTLKDKVAELEKKNERLKKSADETAKREYETERTLALFAESMRRAVDYETYEALRRYAVKASKLYSQAKLDRNICQIKIQELQSSARALEEARAAQYQKDAAARSRALELRQRAKDARAMSETRLREAKEADLLRRANPEVLEYYDDLIRMGEDVAGLRDKILSKRTLLEAQMLVLKERRKEPLIKEKTAMDLSVPPPVKTYRRITPDIDLPIPKGFL